MTITDQRPANPGETCECGDPAKIVYLTKDHGEVPYCGIQHGGHEMDAVRSGLEPVDVYVALSRLADVRVNEPTRKAIARVREAYRTIEPVIRDANEVLVMHEAESGWILADMQNNTPGFDEPDGLWQLMELLSGARDLHNELQRLADLCDPDSTKTREAVDEARAKVDAERMNPAMLEWARNRAAAQEGGDQ